MCAFEQTNNWQLVHLCYGHMNMYHGTRGRCAHLSVCAKRPRVPRGEQSVCALAHLHNHLCICTLTTKATFETNRIVNHPNQHHRLQWPLRVNSSNCHAISCTIRLFSRADSDPVQVQAYVETEISMVIVCAMRRTSTNTAWATVDTQVNHPQIQLYCGKSQQVMALQQPPVCLPSKTPRHISNHQGGHPQPGGWNGGRTLCRSMKAWKQAASQMSAAKPTGYRSHLTFSPGGVT